MDQYPRTTPDRRELDHVLLGRNASNADERRQVLDNAINLSWADEDIGKIERFEPNGGQYYFAMWRYKSGNEV